MLIEDGAFHDESDFNDDVTIVIPEEEEDLGEEYDDWSDSVDGDPEQFVNDFFDRFPMIDDSDAPF